jgi:pantetheine-phosphate adenylyltransferase
VSVGDAAKHVAQAAAGAYDLVLADPPYRVAVDVPFLAAVAAALAPGGRFVLERDRRASDPPAPGLSILRDRVYGDTRVVVFTKAAATVAEGAMPKAAIYPGSFDPLTNGHIDIVERGLRMFDRVVLAIANNPSKNHLFSFDERMAMAKETLGHHAGIEFDTFDGLLVDYAKQKKISTLLRGLRALSDFEYEFQLAIMNRKLASDIDTVFMMTSDESFYLSSRLVREVASFGADVRGMVPLPVYEALRKRYGVG